MHSIKAMQPRVELLGRQFFRFFQDFRRESDSQLLGYFHIHNQRPNRHIFKRQSLGVLAQQHLRDALGSGQAGFVPADADRHHGPLVRELGIVDDQGQV